VGAEEEWVLFFVCLFEKESWAGSTPSTEPDVGLDLTALRSWPEQKSRIGCLIDWATQAPLFCFFRCNERKYFWWTVECDFQRPHRPYCTRRKNTGLGRGISGFWYLRGSATSTLGSQVNCLTSLGPGQEMKPVLLKEILYLRMLHTE